MRITGATTLVPALNAAVWAIVFLDDRTGPGLLVVPPLVVAVVTSLRRPLVGVVVLGIAHVTALVVGVRYGGLELLAGSMIVLGWAGRYGRSVWIGALGVVACAAPAALRDGFEVRKLLVTTFVFGFVWLFGRLVRHRAHAAVAAVEEAERLAATDPQAHANPRARAERRQVADESAADLRAAVHDMLAGIDQVLASDTPHQGQLRAIRERGARTVEELRRLLVLLREEPVEPAAPHPPTPTLRAVHVDLVLACVAALVSAAAMWVADGWADEPWLPVAYAGLVAALAVRSTTPLVAGLLLTLAMAPLVVTPPTNPDALLPLAGGIATVVWVLVDRQGARAAATSISLVGVSVALASRFGLDGVAFIGVVLMVSFAAGLAWGEPDRILLRARQRSDVLRSNLESAVAEAVRQERLHIARDLHDATSHAVGIMLLQVSAAEAQLHTSPAKARAALTTARDAGARAREATRPLLPGLHEAIPRDAGSLRTELLALVAQWRRAGMEVTATVDPPALLQPGQAVTCYRVVQEALTNCSRHAPGAAVTVRVLVDARQLLVEVEDTGATGAVSSPASGGMGLAGLRERVAAVPGHFSAAPGGSGFRVTARFDLLSPTRSRP